MKQRWIGLSLVLVLFFTATVMAYSKNSDVSNVKVRPVAGEPGKPGKKVKISFWFANITPDREAGFKELIRIFEKQNPDIEVDFLGIPGDSRQKLDMAIAANEAPDCSDIVQFAMPSYIARKSLVRLDGYYSKWTEKNQVVPAALDTVRSFDPSGKKRLFGLPMASNIWVLWARPDWFAEAGLEMPKTWDDFFRAVKVLSDKKAGRYGIALRGGAGGGTTLEYLMYSYSGITKYFTADGKCTINDPKHVEFVEKYLGLYGNYTAEGDLNNGWTELAAAFQSGRAAMVFHNLGSSSAHAKIFSNDTAKFAAVPLPMGDKGYNVHPALSVSGYVMYSNSKHKNETWKFISYLCSAEPAGVSAKFIGIMPMHKQALKAPWVQELPYFKMAADLLASPKTRFYEAPINYPEYSSIMSSKIEPMIQQVMVKRLSAKDFLDQWARLMIQMKKDYGKYSNLAN